jgi:predicted CoA-binding protein
MTEQKLVNEIEETMENCEVTEVGKKSKKPLIILCGVAVVAGIAAIVRKNKGKCDELMIKKLTKKGYNIIPPLPELDDINETKTNK